MKERKQAQTEIVLFIVAIEVVIRQALVRMDLLERIGFQKPIVPVQRYKTRRQEFFCIEVKKHDVAWIVVAARQNADQPISCDI